MRSPGRMIKAYIDTNIFIYAIAHHPSYGAPCSRILRDFGKGVYEPQGSLLVAVELLGALSRVEPSIARRAVELYLALDIPILPLSVEAICLASIVNEVVNVKYDAIHAALMMLHDVPVIITNDVDDWLRIARDYDAIREMALREGYRIGLSRIEVVTPDSYPKWYESLSTSQDGLRRGENLWKRGSTGGVAHA